MPTPSRLPQVKQVPIQSPLKGINRVTGRESQTPDYCWDAVNVLPFDSLGRARVAQRFGVGKAWGVPLGSTQIQGMLPVNYIAYSSTGGPNVFPIAVVPTPGVSTFTPFNVSTGVLTPTGSTGTGVIGGGPPNGPIGGTPGGTPSTSTGGGPRRPGSGPGGSGGPGGPSGPGSFPSPSTSQFPSTLLPGLFGGPSGAPRFGGPGGQGGPGGPSGPGTGGSGTGTGTRANFSLTIDLASAGVMNAINGYVIWVAGNGSGNFIGPHFLIQGDGFITQGLLIQAFTQSGLTGPIITLPVRVAPAAAFTTIVTFNATYTGSGSTRNMLIEVTCSSPTSTAGTSTLFNGSGPDLGSTYSVDAVLTNSGSTGGAPGSYFTTLS